MLFSRVCFKVAGGSVHDAIILFVNDVVNSFGAGPVTKCPRLDEFVNSFAGLSWLEKHVHLVLQGERVWGGRGLGILADTHRF